MTVLTTLFSALSAVAAVGAVFFAWRTVREGRTARGEDVFYRELDRLYHIIELVGNVGVAARGGV